MSVNPSNDQGDAFEAALAGVDPGIRDLLRQLVDDSSYVEPRVVSHLRD